MATRKKDTIIKQLNEEKGCLWRNCFVKWRHIIQDTSFYFYVENRPDKNNVFETLLQKFCTIYVQPIVKIIKKNIKSLWKLKKNWDVLWI